MNSMDMKKRPCKAFDANDATFVSPNNAKIATRYLHEQDYYVCNDTNKICQGQNLWKKNESTSGEKVYTINIEDFTILLQHSINKVSVNIYIYIHIDQFDIDNERIRLNYI